MNNLKVLVNGIIKENPTFVLLLGMCPTLGTTSSALNGMGMGLATMFVLVCSNVVISAIKNLIPDMGLRARIVCHVGTFHSPYRGELHRAGACRSFCFQARTFAFSF